ncbi:MAG: carboxypeptidase regulatory-like domain-containing protein, partial [Desulfatitalea sp.]
MGVWVNSRTPVLAVHPVTDIDQDDLKYRFEIYSDLDLTRTAGYAEVNDPVWQGVSPLQPSTWHYWRVQAVDSHGIPGGWSETGSFFVKENGANQSPHFSFITPAAPVHTNAQGISIRWSDADPDNNARIALYYDTDGSGEDGVLIVSGIEEDPDGTEDYHTWNISSLEGTYHIYAVIADSLSSETIYCPATVTIDHTPPVVSATPAGGSFAAQVQVSLATDETATIYFTMDGSEPGIGSQLYSAPLTISQATTIRFMAVDSAGNQCATATEVYAFEAPDITITASTDKGRALSGIRVYAFTAAGSYTGRNLITDGSGQVHFDPALFAAGNYKFRIDYLGRQFWSQTVALPNTRSIPVVIPEESVTVTVNTAAGPAAGVRVYLFSESGAYLGQYLTTNAEGQVLFNLPVGMIFNFRADLYGSQYWSGATTVAGGGANAAPVNAGGGLMQVEVNKAADQPLAGIRVYLFNTSGTYLGYYANTDADGRVGFDVPAGSYRVRADYLGYQFWSADTQVVTDTLVTVTLPHQRIQVAVEARYQQAVDPIAGVNVYLFSAAGTYMGITKQSDDQGHVFFDLPETAYKVRADYMGRQFWSDVFTWQDPLVSVPMADARVTVSGAGYPLPGVKVYLFTEASSYLGRNATTDANGQCTFRVPEGTYRFRADYQSSQFWSGPETLTADQIHDVGVSTGGGSFAFTILKGVGQPLAGTQCYLFNANNSYIGLHGATDTNGQVTFNLSSGNYRLRVDHLGYQFWSNEVQVPAVLSHEMTIPHTPVDVTVLTAAGPVPNSRVYLFKEDGVYQGLYLQTDAQGRVQFNLPVGVGYMFRADLLGGQYWSDPIDVPQAAPAEATIDAGGGSLQLTVQNGSSGPMAGLTVYLYSANDTYLGQQQTTTAAGSVTFNVPERSYKLRVDYLGYSYWTDVVDVMQNVQLPLTIDHQPVALTVQGQFQGVNTPLAALRVFLFTPTGTYLGHYQDTDAAGQVTFSLPGREYMVRADFMGRQYWSDTFNGQNEAITIPMADAQVSVTGAGLPKQGIRVYL